MKRLMEGVMWGALLWGVGMAVVAQIGGGGGRVAAVQYYVQVAAGPPYTGQLRAGVEGTSALGFGSVEAFAFNVTEEASSCSRRLGSVRGYTVQTSYVEGAGVALEVEVVAFNNNNDDGSSGGGGGGLFNGTLSLQGLVLPTETNELAIVGGSGAFAAARGVALITRISPALYHHALFLY